MEKKNEQAVKNNETMELTPEQMDKVSGGAGSNQDIIFCCPICLAKFTNSLDFIHHMKTCPPYNYVDPNPQPAPLPKPDEKIEPAG